MENSTTDTSNNAFKKQFFIWTSILVTIFFVLIIGYTLVGFQKQIEHSAHQDMSIRNQAYVNTIYSTFKAKADAISTLRDDLELYETRGQMWVHLAAHAGEKVFDDWHNSNAHLNSYREKMRAYQASGELSRDRLTPQLRKMLENIRTRENAFGSGMKFFYIGIPSTSDNETLATYHQYQDSSLWVPDPDVDGEYNPFIRPWYIAGQQAGRDKVFFTEPYAERRTKEALVSAATEIEINGVKGTLAAGLSIRPIMKDMLRTFDESSEVMVFSKGAKQDTEYVKAVPKYVFSSQDPSLGNKFTAYNDPNAILEPTNSDMMKLYNAVKDQRSGVLEWLVNGQAQIIAFSVVPDIEWKVFTSIPKELAMKDANDMRWRVILAFIIGMITLLMSMAGVVLLL